MNDDKIRVALVDDHELFRKGMAAVLNVSDEIQVVSESENGRDFLDKGDLIESLDVVLLDLEMPILDGFETLKELRKVDPDIKVLLLSMHSDERFILHFMESGANGYLHKNTKPQEVETAIRKIHSSGFYFSDIVSQALLKGVKKKGEREELPVLSRNESLTLREIEVLTLLCQEMTTTEIGEKLFLSPRTIEGYRRQLFDKIGAKNLAGLVLFAVRNGIIEA
jgi:DNA-binding NarL/FixJ family response regulator